MAENVSRRNSYTHTINQQCAGVTDKQYSLRLWEWKEEIYHNLVKCTHTHTHAHTHLLLHVRWLGIHFPLVKSILLRGNNNQTGLGPKVNEVHTQWQCNHLEQSYNNIDWQIHAWIDSSSTSVASTLLCQLVFIHSCMDHSHVMSVDGRVTFARLSKLLHK